MPPDRVELAARVAGAAGPGPASGEAIISAMGEMLSARLVAGERVALDGVLSLEAGPGSTRAGIAALAADLAERTGLDAEASRRVLESVASVMREDLVAGRRADLGGVLSVRLVAGEPDVMADPGTGRRQVSPGTVSLGVLPGEALSAALGGTRLAVYPDPSLRARLEQTHRPTILVLVQSQDIFAMTLEFHFERRGWTVLTTSSIRKALLTLASAPVPLVLAETRMPGADEVLAAAKTAPDAGPISVVGLYPGGVAPASPLRLALIPDVCLVEPFEVRQLLVQTEEELGRMDGRGSDLVTSAHIRLPTTQRALDEVNDLASRLFDVSGMNRDGVVAMQAAFREAVGNAAQHGNRYHDDAYIDVRYTLDTTAIMLTVTDEGRGFDYSAYVQRGQTVTAADAARERHKEGGLGGLGIMLMLRCTDRLEYNDPGNQVTLFKKLTSGARA